MLVECKLCGQKFHWLPPHLHKHSLTTAEYKKLFLDAKLWSESYREHFMGYVRNRPPSHYQKMKHTVQKQYDEGREPWNKGKPFMRGEAHPLYGKHHTEKTRKKMKEHHWSKTQPDRFDEFIEKNRPNNPTVYEDIFFDTIRVHYKVIRQKRVATYTCDFYIPELNLIVEIDGYKKRPKRDETIMDEGYEVIHFKNSEIENNLGECIEIVSEFDRKV